MMIEGLAAFIQGIENGTLPEMEVILFLPGLVLKGKLMSTGQLKKNLRDQLEHRESPGDAANLIAATESTGRVISRDYLHSAQGQNVNGTAWDNGVIILVQPQIIAPAPGNFQLPYTLYVSYSSVLAYTF